MRNTGLEFSAKGQLGISHLGNPTEPGSNEILLKTLYTGLTNGTERHAFLSEHGYGGGFPSHHGYQHVSQVVKIGKEVTQYKMDDIVFFGEYKGHRGWNIVNENALMIKLPQDTDYKYCALFGVAGVALRAVRRMGISHGDKVWVAGQGPIGHFLGQAAGSMGASVTVTDMIDTRLERAREWGAQNVIDVKNSENQNKIKEFGPYHFIYDCCSVKTLLSDIYQFKLLAHGGTVGMMAVTDQVNYPWSLLHSTEGRIETSCHFIIDDLVELLSIYKKGDIKIKPMVSHDISIDDAPQIYKMLANNASDLFGVIFDWT